MLKDTQLNSSDLKGRGALPDSRASRKSYFVIIYLFWGASGNTSSLFLFLFWLQNLGPQSGCIVICPRYKGIEKWLGHSAQRVVSAEKVGPRSGSRCVGSTRPCAGLLPSGSLGCPVSQTLSPARPTEPLLLGQRQLVIECSLCTRGCTPDYTSPHFPHFTDEEAEACLELQCW